MVWIPQDGTTHRPSSTFNLSFPISPFRREKVVSAGVTPRLRKHSRVWLYTQYVRLFIVSLCTRARLAIPNGRSPTHATPFVDIFNSFNVGASSAIKECNDQHPYLGRSHLT